MSTVLAQKANNELQFVWDPAAAYVWSFQPSFGYFLNFEANMFMMINLEHSQILSQMITSIKKRFEPVFLFARGLEVMLASKEEKGEERGGRNLTQASLHFNP